MANKIKNKIAVFGYVLLEKLPSEGGLKTEVSGLSDYLSWLYKFALAAAAFLAVLMIVIGGIQMIVGGASETARSDGKKRIEQAIWGLLLAITAWLILYSINPDLVKTGLTIPPITIEAPVSAPTVGGYVPGRPTTWPPGSPPAGTYSDTQARTELGLAGIIINKADCAYYGQTNCTSLYGLPSSAVQNLKNLCTGGCEITGGTEPGHQTHGPGKPIVDIRYDTALREKLDSWSSQGKVSYICEQGSLKVSCNGSLTPDHFHVVFK
ncbi:MAG: hypothetical protein WC587_00745 [Candidatus Paceibacterota bacterium]